MNSGSPNTKPHAEKKKEEIQSTYRAMGPYLSMGFQLAAVVVVFFLIGNWIDNRYGIDPIGKLVGSLIGMVGGFFKFFKSVGSLIANEERDRAGNNHES
jgi:F0F1-type ATP synthase assembly protein I